MTTVMMHVTFPHYCTHIRLNLFANFGGSVKFVFILCLCTSREVEEELEVVWQAATRENQQIKETLLDAKITANHHIRAVSGSASPGWHSQNADEDTTSTQHKPHSPELQRRATFKSVLDHQNSSLDEKQKYGLDYYC